MENDTGPSLRSVTVWSLLHLPDDPEIVSPAGRDASRYPDERYEK
jgi:hypothetical protein